MSEFKFACPVCGQHITADSASSGTQIECPTCFRKIVVPQAPASDEPKLILSASQVGKPRPSSADAASGEPLPRPTHGSGPLAVVLLVLLCVIGAAAWVWRDKIFRPAPPRGPQPTNVHPHKPAIAAPAVVYRVPTNVTWTLDLTNAVIPDAVAAGSVHGSGFLCERAWAQGGVLSLRQGKTSSPDLAVFIHLFAHQGEELSGKTVTISPERMPPLPRVVLRWKEEGREKPVNKGFNKGYALKLIFGEATRGRLPGRIYLCLPDEEKSFVAGTFEAEIRKPPPPKRPPPGPPKPKG